ncbi:CVNH domain-containing protein [Collimonas humicola]|uniref:CVNH domain-containing protein n=1 Tax=Collimonas humicola TaxID=2825886 RepID=UPI001B8CAF31|nr:CVNH domain-containing protein [Collimonas humicola]
MLRSAIAALVVLGLTACAADPYSGGYSQYSSSGNYGYTPAPVPAYGGGYGRDYSRGDDDWAPPGSYRQSCRDIIVRRGVLEATCGNGNGSVRTSTALYSCRSGNFENINGNLQCAGGRDHGRNNRDLPPGSYLQSCSDIGVRNGVLEASCGGSGNRRVQSSVSISSCRSGSFSNINGYLQCDR